MINMSDKSNIRQFSSSLFQRKLKQRSYADKLRQWVHDLMSLTSLHGVTWFNRATNMCLKVNKSIGDILSFVVF